MATSCPRCSGDSDGEECGECQGTGCSSCNGTGAVRCKLCNGGGVLLSDGSALYPEGGPGLRQIYAHMAGFY